MNPLVVGSNPTGPKSNLPMDFGPQWIEANGVIDTTYRSRGLRTCVYYAIATCRAKRDIAADLVALLRRTPRGISYGHHIDPVKVGQLLNPQTVTTAANYRRCSAASSTRVCTSYSAARCGMV